MSEPPPDPATTPAGAPEKIDFDRAEPTEPATAATGLACGTCRDTITTEYWQIAGKTLCESCRSLVVRAAEDGRRGSTFGRAMLLGGAAALGCGIGYAIFVGLTKIQFALITIGIGWAVGRTIQKVTRGFGSQKHQVLAVALTYFATTMGYFPSILKGISNAAASGEHGGAGPGATSSPGSPPPPAADSPSPGRGDDPSASPRTAGIPSAAPAGDAPPPAGAAPPPKGSMGAAVVLLVVFVIGLMLVAPFLDVTSGFSGILGVLIIFFGLRTAWRVAKGVDVTVSGPYKVGSKGAA